MSDSLSYRNEIRRKLVHLSSFWMPCIMLIFSSYRWELAAFFAILTVLSLLVEHSIANGNEKIRRIYQFFFHDMLREKPRQGAWVISGGPPVLAASSLVLAVCPPVCAAAAMALMLGGDTAAALIGKRFGKIRFQNGKSLEGCIAFLIAGALSAGIFLFAGHVSPGRICVAVIPGAATGMMAECFEKQIHVDDNLGIPLVSGIVMQLMLTFCRM